MLTSARHFFQQHKLISLEEQKRIKETQQQVAEWIGKHQKNYIAHAIWEDNVKDVLKGGSLNSAEAQLRNKGSVSYEEGSTYGKRGTKGISTILAELKETHNVLPKRIKLENRIPLMEALMFNLIDSKEYEKFFETNDDKARKDEPISIRLKDGKDYPVTYHKVKKEYFEVVIYDGINDIPYLEKTGSLIFYLDQLKQHSDSLGFQIASDMLSDTPIDKTLALVWEKYKELQLNSDYRKLAIHLKECRESVIPPTKLNPEIRAAYNGIWWGYGDVVALSGHAEKFMSVLSKGCYTEELGKPLEEIKLPDSQQIGLREPFENGGEFFSWDLAQEDTIVIGPKKILEKYIDAAKSKEIKLFYIDDMNQDQLKFFQVPARLQPIKIAATTTEIKVENPLLEKGLKSLAI